MRFGFHTGYWSAGPPAGAAGAVRAADELGLDSVWTAESYGSDAFTPLAWWGSQTNRVRLGTGIAQLAARTPTATAMAALTLDHLSGGRFILGLGASGPQVVEGWYGQPYPRPLERTREYVDIVRQVLAREAPVTFSGRHFTLPHDGGTRLGKALRSTVHPVRSDLPIHLAAQGPKNTALAAEIADGWLPAFVSPALDAEYRENLETGFARRDAARSPRGEFEVSAAVPAVIGDDLETAADQVRPHLALYIGGMGSESTNFHREAIARAGYRDVCDEVTAKYLAGDKAGAAAAIPTDLVTDVALVGTPSDITTQLARWEASCVTTLILQTDPRMLPSLVQALH
ncbi:LLM class F420-dependent oxidoreductase [Ruania alba]|uniref:Probable F420-dependent oxidoreductase, Rv3520c family n=1 Tax=Ruania alba TaxID=648782 RepID=A0A1H5LWU9_9MICO|nr:LLM class F420-dependent oxidoreductase [Ruania alba]SEE81519.1 probable F420-dependent oxidoreductase, Rv3520c family [Ruania alba]